MTSCAILDQIGATPLIPVDFFEPRHGCDTISIHAKAEYLNPGGSIKDRIAFYIIREAEKRGELKKGMSIAEATSGNTGIAVAMVGRVLGYPVTIIMPDNMSRERKEMIRALNAELILTPGKENVAGAVEVLNRMRREDPDLFVPDQFRNPDNTLAHYHSTGPEIMTDMDGQVDIFVCGVGSGGTLMGAGGYLKERNPDMKLIAVEPKDSSALLGHSPGLHRIEGIGDGFIPEILDPAVIDMVLEVDDGEALSTARGLASEKGLLVGISSGANILAALTVARMFGHDKRIVTVLPDGIERYFSTDLCKREGEPVYEACDRQVDGCPV